MPQPRAHRLLLLTLLLGSARAWAAEPEAPPENLALVKDVDLHFGDVVSGPVGGTVQLTPAGARFPTGGVILGNTGAASPARFTVTGNAGWTFAITLPTAIDLEGPGGATLRVDGFTSDPAGSATLPPTATLQLSVGAQLHVGAQQPQGAYSGAFVVTIAYN